MQNKAVFLDRDGTMAPDVHYCSRPEDFDLFPDTAEAIKLLNENGYKVIVITNQSGIARGYFTAETLEKIHLKMKTLLAEKGARIDGIYYCRHHPDEKCDCRKPNTKLIKLAKGEFNIDLNQSYIVGDLDSDIQLGKNAGCKTILVREIFSITPPDIKADNLIQAVRLILNEDNKKQRDQYE